MFLLTIDLESLQLERLDEVLPETHEMICNVSFIVDCDVPPGKSGADRLIDVDHVGQICEATHPRQHSGGYSIKKQPQEVRSVLLAEVGVMGKV